MRITALGAPEFAVWPPTNPTPRERVVIERATILRGMVGRSKLRCLMGVWWANRGLNLHERRYLFLVSLGMADQARRPK